MKKFLAIPILIFVYIFFIDFLVTTDFSEFTGPNISGGGPGETVGFGQSVSVSVTRPYLFGLVRLPVYSESVGYIGDYHDAFFVFIIILTIALIITEFKHKKETKGRKLKPKKR